MTFLPIFSQAAKHSTHKFFVRRVRKALLKWIEMLNQNRFREALKIVSNSQDLFYQTVRKIYKFKF